MGRRWLLVAVVALVAFAAAFALSSRSSDDGDPDPAPSAELDALEGEARELVALVDAGRTRAHHAVYEQSGGDRFEVWVDGDRVREDLDPADGAARAVLRTGDDHVDCTRADGAWECAEADDAGSGLQERLEQLSADLVGLPVTAESATVAGVDVRCFAVTGPETPVEICLTGEGVLARLVAGEDRLELVSLDGEVPDEVFDPPAPIDAG